jgi:hypothetical protein
MVIVCLMHSLDILATHTAAVNCTLRSEVIRDGTPMPRYPTGNERVSTFSGSDATKRKSLKPVLRVVHGGEEVRVTFRRARKQTQRPMCTLENLKVACSS